MHAVEHSPGFRCPQCEIPNHSTNSQIKQPVPQFFSAKFTAISIKDAVISLNLILPCSTIVKDRSIHKTFPKRLQQWFYYQM